MSARWLRGFGGAALLALVACSGALPPAPPHANVAPAPRPPPMELCWLEYATDRQPADYGLAGDSGDARWEVTFSGLLIRHPKGDLLIDVDNSSHFRVTDHDSKQADAVVAKLAQLHEQDPALVILPAHDRKAWASAFGAPGHCVGAAR